MDRPAKQSLVAFTIAVLLAAWAPLSTTSPILADDSQPRESEIPYPITLDAAAVVQSRISDINREALVLGNGDLNALLWDRNGTLCLRVGKNDVWDARVDTSRDVPLMKVDVPNRKWSGGGYGMPVTASRSRSSSAVSRMKNLFGRCTRRGELVR